MALRIFIILLGSLNLCCCCQVVDLSSWNREIELRTAREAGLVGAIHKATEGTYFTDQRWAKRRREAEETGVLWGAYHFGTMGPGAEQADYFLRAVGDLAGILLAIDLEPYGKDTMTLAQAEEFVRAIKSSTGKLPLLYGSPSFLSDYISKSRLLASCPLWVAHWTQKSQPMLPKGATSWVLWQYSNGAKGGIPRTINGISNPVDCNRYNGEIGNIAAKWSNNLANLTDY